MIRRSLNLTDFLLRIVMLGLPSLAFAGAAYIRFMSGLIFPVTLDINVLEYFGLLLFTTLIWTMAVEHYGLSRPVLAYQGWRAIRKAFLASMLTFTTTMAATFFYRSVTFSRVFVALSGFLLLGFLLITQQGFRWIMQRARRSGLRIRVLIVGADRFAELTAQRLREGKNMLPCSIVGFIRLPEQEVEVSAGPVFDFAKPQQWPAGKEIDDIVVGIPPERLTEIPAITEKLERFCTPVRLALDFGEGILVRERLFDFGGNLMLDLRMNPAETITYVVLKRTFDIVFSLFILVLTAPLMLLIALAIRLGSPGPAIFVQDRIGLNGQIFHMYKFRTMRVSDPVESNVRWTTPDDPRCTRLGAFLRRTNLDEFPQFFNVLGGNMSVVGPRPERPYFVRKFLKDVARYNTRHHLKVGITGWAQVNGLRGDTSIPERIEHDLYYLRNWSLAFDLRIIFLTFVRGFTDRNAY